VRTGERRCPACAGVETLPRGAKNGVPLAECRACATLYAASSPAAAGFDYDGYYDEANLSVPDFVGARLDEIFASFAPYRRTNRLLDIGCGAGSLLEAARRAGWEAHGTEVSRPAVEHARRAGFEVFCGDLSAAPFPEGHFDVVTASEILEHLDDPRAMLREVARVLRPGGLFWATTPHGRGISAKVLGLNWSIVVPPDHLHLFSLKGVRRLLEAAGFRSVKVVAHAVNPYELLDGVRNRARREEVGTEQLNKERIQSSYQLNEMLTSSPSRQAIRSLANGVLGLARLGDDLKIRAVK